MSLEVLSLFPNIQISLTCVNQNNHVFFLSLICKILLIHQWIAKPISCGFYF